MNYWITTQWPLEVGETRRFAVWLPDDGRQNAGQDLEVGDLVHVYESRTGRARLDRQSRLPVTRQKGTAGLIATIELETRLIEQMDAQRHDYDDGSRIRWGFRANGRPAIAGGFVPRRLVNLALGYKPDYNLHGFGDQHSGLKRLTDSQYRQLEALFRANGGIDVR